jgi:hypothetical protein
LPVFWGSAWERPITAWPNRQNAPEAICLFLISCSYTENRHVIQAAELSPHPRHPSVDNRDKIMNWYGAGMWRPCTGFSLRPIFPSNWLSWNTRRKKNDPHLPWWSSGQPCGSCGIDGNRSCDTGGDISSDSGKSDLTLIAVYVKKGQ